MIIAILDDPDTIDKAAALGRRFGLPVVLSMEGQDPREEVQRGGKQRLLLVDVDAVGARILEVYQSALSGPGVPVVAVGNRSDKARVIAVLRAGADCYLPKPVDADLLAAHVEALLRRQLPPPPMQVDADTPRQQRRRSAETASPVDSVTVRGLTLDFGRKEVRIEGNPVPVTPAEYRLLACLAGRLGRVVSSSELLKVMSGYDCPEHEAQEIVKVHVSRLRGKIDRNPEETSYLLNVRGFGYLLERRSSPHS